MSTPWIRKAESIHGWYLGFLQMFHTDPEGKRNPSNNVAMSGTIDVALAATRDTVNWFLVDGRRPFLSLGPPGSFDSQMVFLESMSEVGDRLYFYYNGWDVEHGIWVGTPTVVGHAAIGLATLRLDGFVALAPTEGPAALVTVPFVWEGSGLDVNVDALGGSMRVELLDEQGALVEGATEADCVPVTTDDVRTRVEWSSSPDLSRIAGETVRLRFVLAGDVKLYAFRIVGGA